MTSTSDPRPSVDWPLVGRDGELRLLTELLRRPGARGAVLAGPPGAGKTRLALEVLDAAERAGLASVRIAGTPCAANIPYGALAPLLPDPASAAGPGGDALALVTASMAERSGGRRTAVMIDDAQSLDGHSATLVYQLAATGAGILVVTLRSGEGAPHAVTGLWKEGLLERVELPHLDGERIEELLSAALGGPVDRATVVRLAARCRGNLVFLRELVLGATSAGILVRHQGSWRLQGPLAPTHRLIELVEARLAGLGPDERHVLAALAIGEVLGPAPLAAVVPDPVVLERLEAACFISATLSRRRLEFRLTHPVHGEVIRSRFSLLRHRRLLTTLAEAVEATGARRAEDVLALAAWRLEVGGASDELLLAGAVQALRGHELALAERLARAAGGGFPARLALARVASLQGSGDQADAELAQLGADAADDGERAQVAVLRLENLARQGRDEEGVALAAPLVAAGAGRDEVEAARAGLLLAAAGPAAAAPVAQALRERGAGPARAGAALVAALALSRAGQVTAALDAADETGAAAVEGRRPDEDRVAGVCWLGGDHRLARAEALGAAGRLAEAHELVAERYATAAAGVRVDHQAWSAAQLARVLLLQGRVASAARYAREAASLFGQLSWPSPHHQALITLATATALRGRGEEARQVLAEIDGLRLPANAWTGGDLLTARAWAAVAAHDLAAGRQRLDEAVEAGREVGDRVGQSAALHDLARLGAAKRVEDDLAAVAGAVEGDLVPARAAHVAALAREDAAALKRASGVFEALGARLLAAEAATDAGVVLRRAGDPRSAAAQERASSAIAAGCEGAVTPSLGRSEIRALLTPAERETSLLAAQGRSNKEIAEALYLSVRTVENRLQRVYEKLGVSGRAALAAALEE